MTVTGRKGTVLVVALVLSVCLNLFAAGTMIGRDLWPDSRRGRDRGLARLLTTLPEDARSIVRERFAAHRTEVHDRLAALREARQQVASLLGRPDVPAEQLEAALADLRQRSTATQEVLHEALVEAAGAMPPEVRAQWQPSWKAIR